jgi:ureidoglycolate lyase
LKAEALTADAFAPFGEIVAHAGDGRRHTLDQAFVFTNADARPRMWVNRYLQKPLSPPVVIDKMERHPHSFQTLIPLHAARFLVAVAPNTADGVPDFARIRAFMTAPGQGVTYRPNVWHYAFTPLEGPNEIVVMIGLTGREDDMIELPIETTVTVTWDRPALVQ